VTPPGEDATDLSSPVDMEIFLEIAGTEERVPDMASRYIGQTREQLAKLKDAVQRSAAVEVKRIAHSAAGSSAMCGMAEMVTRLRALERMGHDGQLADAADAFAQLAKEFERVEHFFDAYQKRSMQRPYRSQQSVNNQRS